MSMNVSQINSSYTLHPEMNKLKSQNNSAKVSLNRSQISFGISPEVAIVSLISSFWVGMYSLFGLASSKMSKKSSYLLDAIGFLKAKSGSLKNIPTSGGGFNNEYESASNFLINKHKYVLNPYGFLTQVFYASPRDFYKISKGKIRKLGNSLQKAGYPKASKELSEYLTKLNLR